MGESKERMAVLLFERLKKEKKFLLILDDVWERVDLDDVGIPKPEIHEGCKIILTSQSLDACRQMETDVDLKVDVLSGEEAWGLFSQNAGKVVDLEYIKLFAKAVTKECSGLPLVIIMVGRAMRGKTMVEMWKDALSVWQRSVPYIEGIEKVFFPLKWSYDSLQGMINKNCFLYFQRTILLKQMSLFSTG